MLATTMKKRHQIIHCNYSPISPSTTINDLNDDALLEIITKLSPRNMVQMRSVSKLWHKLISTICIPAIASSPLHAFLYRTYLPPQEPGQQSLTWEISWLKPPSSNIQITSLLDLCHFLPFKPAPFELLDCVNGFLLFFDRSVKQFYLCNPSIEHYVTFPPNSPQHENEICKAAALIFNPLCRVAYLSESTRFTLNVFSIAKLEWDVYKFDFEPSFGTQFLRRYIFSDGFLHLLALDGYLMRFDMKQVSVRAIELPQIVVRGHPIGGIAVSQGRLHYTWDDDSKMMIWTLGDHDWVLKYTISYQYFVDHPLCTNLPPDQPWFCVYAFDPVSDVVYVGNPNEIYRYHPCTKDLEKVCAVNISLTISAGLYFVYPYSVNLSTLYDVCIGGK